MQQYKVIISINGALRDQMILNENSVEEALQKSRMSLAVLDFRDGDQVEYSVWELVHHTVLNAEIRLVNRQGADAASKADGT